MKRQAFKRYTRIVLMSSLGIMGCIGAFNWLVNPYNLFPTPVFEGFNAYKPELARRQFIAYAYDVVRKQPDVIILGTSRAMHVDVDQPAWKGRNVYNLAMASSTFYEQFRYFQHATSTGQVKAALWGIDTLSFVRRPNRDFDERRLLFDSTGSRQPFDLSIYISDAVPSLFSSDALRSSLSTLKKQSPTGEKVRLHGNRPERVRNAGGHHRMFLRLERGAAETPLPISRVDELDLDSFRHALRHAHTHDIDLRLFITPEHARLTELFHALGHGDLIEQCKRALVRINHEEAILAGTAPFPLWDFNQYNSITTETVPPQGDTETLMKWYWEGSHFNAQAAALVVARVYGKGAEPVPADFGRLLAAENLDAALAANHAARLHYSEAHPEVIAELREVIKQAGRDPAKEAP